MRRFHILSTNRNNDFYLVQDELEEYYILEISDQLELGDIIIEYDLTEYICNDNQVFVTIQWKN
ncbi:MAG: hypothetical protein RSD79_06460, partial [Cetobacterium sp.]